MAIIDFYLEKNFSIVLLGGRDVELVAQGIMANINSSKFLNYAGKYL